MATIELGTWQTRAGYVGDAACTYCARSLARLGGGEETDFMSVVLGNQRAAAQAGEEGSAEGDAPVQLWSLRSFQANADAHISYLRHMKGRVLGCGGVDEPLLLVVPELWHERLDVMKGIFELVLEDGELTNALYCARPSVCWALASGRASAVVLDVGHSHTTVTGVLDGYALRHTVDSSPVGGAAVTAQFAEAAASFLDSYTSQRFPAGLPAPARRLLIEDVASDVKHVVGYVSVGGASPSGAVPSRPTLSTPDGQTLAFSEEQCCAPYEVFFGRGDAAPPSSAAFNVADMLVRCKQHVDPEWQLRAVPHVVGGAQGRVRGFCERLLHELKQKDAAYFRYERDNAVSTAKSDNGAWIGASIAASSSSFDPLWVTRREWEEEGESVMYRKLFY